MHITYIKLQSLNFFYQDLRHATSKSQGVSVYSDQSIRRKTVQRSFRHLKFGKYVCNNNVSVLFSLTVASDSSYWFIIIINLLAISIHNSFYSILCGFPNNNRKSNKYTKGWALFVFLVQVWCWWIPVTFQQNSS